MSYPLFKPEDFSIFMTLTEAADIANTRLEELFKSGQLETWMYVMAESIGVGPGEAGGSQDAPSSTPASSPSEAVITPTGPEEDV